MTKFSALDYATLLRIPFILLSMDTYVQAIFPSGATTGSCVSLQPQDSSSQDPSTNPYPLVVYKEQSNTVAETYMWNETLTVSIGSYPNVLRGIILQARSVGSVGAVGEFVNVQDGFQYLRCSGSPTGTITNTEDSLFYKLSFQWSSGGHYLGDIEFLVTVGNTRGEYWTFRSDVIAEDETTLPHVVITCPEDILVASLPESNGNIVSWSSPDCSNSSGHAIDVTCNDTNGQFVTISPAKTVHCWCTSVSSTVATCDFQYTVEDITPPVIRSCTNKANGLFFYLPNDQSKAKATWLEPHANDNSGSDVIVSRTGGNSGDLFLLGTTTITYTFTDPSGNNNQCIFNITVIDNIPPLITGCEYNNRTMYKYLPPDKSVINVTWEEPFATDNSGLDVELNKTGGSSGDLFTLGTKSVDYIFTDTSGNSVQCTFDVTVLDISPPVIIDCGIQNGTSLEAYLPDNSSTVAVSWSEPRVTDNSGVMNISQTGGSSGDEFSLGVTTITYVFSDTSGNSNECRFYVDVKDVTPPTITCSYHNEVIRAYLPESGSGVSVSWIEPHATDNSGEEVQILQTGGSSGGVFTLGTTNVTYTFTDKSGNSDQCTLQVLVLDIIPPTVYNCDYENNSLETYLGANENKATVTWTEPNAIDNSGKPVTVTKTGGGSGDLFPLGRSIVNYTFTDSSGNTNQCIFYITVIDNIPPLISGCEDNNRTLHEYLPHGKGVINVTWEEPFATDNSGLDVKLNKTGGNSGDLFTLGTTVVEYIFTDTSGNSAHCTLNVNVLDFTPFVVIDCGIQNGTTLEAYLPDNASTVAVSWSEPRVTDNSGVVNISQTGGSSGDDFPIGMTAITYVFRDTSGNSNQCIFYIEFKDITPPKITCPYHNEVVQAYLPNNGSEVSVSWIEPQATDNSAEEVELLHTGGSNGGVFTLGATNITYTFTDTSGNSDQCTLQVLVLDVVPPVVHNCDRENKSLETYLPADDNQATVTWAEPTATDNSGVPVAVTKTGGGSGDLFPLGRSTVNYTFTDSSGNSNFCTFDVLVLDITPPVIMGCSNDSADIEVPLPWSKNYVTVIWRDPIVTDNSGEDVNVTLSGGQKGGKYYRGKTQITYTFTDSSGNVNQCSFNLSVIDTTPPTVKNCPDDIRASLPFDQSTVKAIWKAPSVFDNSGDPVTIVQSGGNISDMFPLGVTNILYKFYDSSGNYNQCNFAVIVKDVTEPVISNCPVIIFTSTCEEKETVSWLEPTATDNSKRSVQIKASENPGDTFTVGNHSVIYTFEDESGNTALCSFVVRVEKKSECVHHASYIAFIAIGFYLLLVCLAIALCAFLLYRRRRNSSQYIISRHYDTFPESGQPHSNLIELDTFRPTGRTAVDDPWTRDGSTAAGGMDPDLCKAGYVKLEKSEKLYDT
ncbi:Hyalin [Holothuria leucospilota]|uniref:Hyalin n=1 Tax=Holothuria leucospilota TaxID=206669 RepID=A0A9Q1H7A4_HOLLE|nr:Hyalin [Holothuria leucospilota]